MSTQIPSDFEPFVKRMVAARRFLSEEDVVSEGLRLLQAKESLREEVQKGFTELDEGLGSSAAIVFERLSNRISKIESEG